MMIEVNNLTKEYRLGVIGHGMLFRDLQSVWARLRNRPDPNSRITQAENKRTSGIFRALENVSFSVKQGEAIGIIGRNGAGKSTLLKIMSRVTTPTSGSISLRGKVASLLEVGTGFHPELSGRENIYLNGAILGMSRREVRSKFDEIVEFAEVGPFIDTPVKRYSSGMYVRLAFAVAAHLNPDILIVDEVLAVGDYKFQKKCIGKMGDLSRGSGITILFVSHNLSLIQELTTRAIWLSEGKLKGVGTTQEIVTGYLRDAASGRSNASVGVFDLKDQPRHKEKHARNEAEIVRCRLENAAGEAADEFEEGEPIVINVEVEVKRPIGVLSIEMVVWDELNTRLFPIISDHFEANYSPGNYELKTRIDPNFLRSGSYLGSLTVRTESLQDGVSEAFRLSVARLKKTGTNNANEFYDKLGSFNFPYTWQLPQRL